jgi:hypothetical protein
MLLIAAETAIGTEIGTWLAGTAEDRFSGCNTGLVAV